VGFRRRMSDKRPCVHPPPIGASIEGRLAWPPSPSSFGHFCKPTRPLKPRVALRRAPALKALSCSDVFFHQLLQLRWLLVGIFALAAFVDVFE